MGFREAAVNAAKRTGHTGRRAYGHISRAVGQTVANQDLDWARTALADVDRPNAPIGTPWRFSIATLIGRHPKVPAVAAKPLGLLDRFGEVSITPRDIGFDGKDVAWEKVLEVRTHSMAGLLPDVTLDKEVDRIRELLPPIPGRKWVVRKAAEGLLTLLMATVETTGTGDKDDDRMVVCEVVYKNRFGRPKRLSGGLFAAAILAGIPEADQSLIVTARAHGIPVSSITSDAILPRTERAGRLRAATTGLATRLRDTSP